MASVSLQELLSVQAHERGVSCRHDASQEGYSLNAERCAYYQDVST